MLFIYALIRSGKQQSDVKPVTARRTLERGRSTRWTVIPCSDELGGSMSVALALEYEDVLKRSGLLQGITEADNKKDFVGAEQLAVMVRTPSEAAFGPYSYAGWNGVAAQRAFTMPAARTIIRIRWPPIRGEQPRPSLPAFSPSAQRFATRRKSTLIAISVRSSPTAAMLATARTKRIARPNCASTPRLGPSRI